MNNNSINTLSNRPQLFLIVIICFASLGYAYYLQIAQGLNACLMCIIARYVILAMGIISLVAFLLTFIKHKVAHWFAKGLHILTYLIVATGIYYVYQHYKIIEAQLNACTINPLQMKLNSLPTVEWWREFFEVTGSCSSVQTMLHGIPIHFTPLIVYVLFFFFSYVYLKYDNYMLDNKFSDEEH